MGEAIYTLTAKFESEKAAKDAQPKVKAFLTEVDNAYSFWQKNRGERMDFWTPFKAQFPMVYKFLAGQTENGRRLEVDNDYSNALSGRMSLVGSIEDIGSVAVHGKILTYSSEVWHFANWRHFDEFMKTEFGALDAVSVSDEQ